MAQLPVDVIGPLRGTVQQLGVGQIGEVSLAHKIRHVQSDLDGITGVHNWSFERAKSRAKSQGVRSPHPYTSYYPTRRRESTPHGDMSGVASCPVQDATIAQGTRFPVLRINILRRRHLTQHCPVHVRGLVHHVLDAEMDSHLFTRSLSESPGPFWIVNQIDHALGQCGTV